ncbi:MAG: hypothetical protein K9L68_11420 [Spirochaetales bacterium]|nr:hypothetical protein [Spirochaetales bacterium]MCF7939197.1 hypothetical protein [Spirochaetales bacterium]
MRLEIDTDPPPEGFSTEARQVLKPIPFSRGCANRGIGWKLDAWSSEFFSALATRFEFM